MDVADIGCVTVVEHQLANMDATTEDVQPEEDLHSPAFVSTLFMFAFPCLPPSKVQDYFHNGLYFFLLMWGTGL